MKEIIELTIYTVSFKVICEIRNGQVTIKVLSIRYNRPKIYVDMDDCIQQIH